MKNEDISKLVEKLEHYNENYRNGNTLISDNEFDVLENKLRELDPDNSYLNKVGNDIYPDAPTVTHSSPMLSMRKVKSIGDLEKWGFSMFKKYGSFNNDQLKIEPKVDGISGTVKYDNNGNLEYIATRGDGHVGFKLLTLNSLIGKIIPEKFIPNSEIRGELYVPKKYTNKFLGKNGSVSLRNICAGILKRKEINDDIECISFVAYDIIGADKSRLSEIDNNINLYSVLSSVVDLRDNFQLYLDELRDKYPFETDGIVVIYNDINKWKKIDNDYSSTNIHHYNVALKPFPDFDYTTLNEIEWNVSRYGNLIPLGLLKPVCINNVTISNVTLNNYRYVLDNHIIPGAILKIIRSGDVIPKVEEIDTDTSKTIVIPATCPSCETKVSYKGVHLVCPNISCEGRVIDSIRYFLSVLDVKHVGVKTIESIVKDSKFPIKDVADFYEAVLENKFKKAIQGDKKREIIFTAIQDSLNNISELDLLIGLGIENVGKKMLINNNLIHIEMVEKYTKMLKDKEVLTGFETNLTNWFDDPTNKLRLAKYKKYFKTYLKHTEIKIVNKPSIAITGKFILSRNQIIEDYIEKYGFKYTDSLNKNTGYLLCADPESSSSKIVLATKFGVPIIRLEDIENIAK